jgi:hypothetical protein
LRCKKKGEWQKADEERVGLAEAGYAGRMLEREHTVKKQRGV